MNPSLEDRLNTIKTKLTPNNEEDKETDSISTLEAYIESKRINIYSRNWNKLETKLKLKKIIEFLEENNDILEDNKNKIIKLVTKLVKTNKLNKSSDVSYDKTECKILEIKYLKYNGEQKCYTWKDQDIIMKLID